MSYKETEKLIGETILTIQDKVAVYYGNEKKPSYESVILYITSHQIYFEESQDIKVYIKNDQIISFENITGNVFKSHKIRLLYSNSKENKVVGKWICDFCLFKGNYMEKDTICKSCSLPKISSSAPLATPTENKEEISCKVCTFKNNHLLGYCEMCDAPLEKEDNRNNLKTRSSNIDLDQSIKIITFSFRGGGQSLALSSIESSLQKKAWLLNHEEPPILKEKASFHGGISGLTQRAEKSNINTQETLREAFSDIDALIERANHMVHLAENIVDKLKVKSAKDIETNPQSSLIDSYFQKLGLESPITKDVAGSHFFLEVAKEVGQVIIPIINQVPYIGVIDVVDVYCIFNKARGIGNLISPSDLMTSFSKFSEAGVPLIFDTFSTGVKVIKHKDLEEDIILDKIIEVLDKENRHSHYFGMDSISIANKLGTGINLEIVNHYLKQGEVQGKLCRDLVPPLNMIIYYLAFPFFEE